ncbi:THO complex subunit 7 homolog [Anneissia japonica]|uniref:THO complex subunit 7 homolog n=1 Tax=Anneissia japonica TaxID=1529436 RepID=UPI0014254F40|nr:THO complex subunit 7 homolog [Anneissia japonica]
MAAITDDEVICKRLLIEGESGGDDRRISTLLKMFIKWCTTDLNEEECCSTYQKMLSTLAQIEFTMEKTQLIHDMNAKEMASYEQLYKTIESKMDEAQDAISASKDELQKAKRVRRNRQEYDALAKVIQKQPDRKETMKKLKELDENLTGLNENKISLEQKLESRQKQFHVLINSLLELQRILQEDEKSSEETLNSTLDSSMDAS